MITYREMTEADIPRGLSLCRSSGWNQLASDWEVFLRLSPRGCRVAVDGEGDVKGTVTTIRYGNHFGWIGMLLMLAFWLSIARAERKAADLSDTHSYGILLGTLGALTGFLASSLVNYNYGDAEVAMMFWFLMGTAMSVKSVQ